MTRSILPIRRASHRSRIFARRNVSLPGLRKVRALCPESEAGLGPRDLSPSVSACAFERAAPALANDGRRVAPGYTERIRGASQRLFFRRHFQFHISNLKFLPPLRSSATDTPARPEARTTRTSSAPASIDSPLRLFPRPILTLSLSAPHFALILNSSARHKEPSGRHHPGVFLFSRVRTKGPVLSFRSFHYISRHSSLLPKPSRERSKEGNTCKEPLFVR